MKLISGSCVYQRKEGIAADVDKDRDNDIVFVSQLGHQLGIFFNH